MSLPGKYENSTQYFDACLKFFEHIKFLFEHPNTKILVENVLDYIKIADIDEEFTENVIDNLNLEENDEINSIFEGIRENTVAYEEPSLVNDELSVPVSVKKKHEIFHLSKAINTICEDIGCDTVVDFGSGLGYMDQLLHEKYNYKVIGLESKKSYVDAAEKRQEKYFKNSLNKVKYSEHFIDRNSLTHITEQIKSVNSDTYCIVGLHSCADLSIVALDLFLQLPASKALVIMPCCYHRMSFENGIFKNFPLSNCLKSFGWRDFYNVPFLRLATQKDDSKTDLKELVFNLMTRAVLEVYASKYNYKLSRKRRKTLTSNPTRNIDIYIQNAKSSFHLCKNVDCISKQCGCNLEFNTDEAKQIWRDLPAAIFKKAAIFILLQRHLQPVLENFILYDRVVYMKEREINCFTKKIADSNISPRCLAMICSK